MQKNSKGISMELHKDFHESSKEDFEEFLSKIKIYSRNKSIEASKEY